MYIMRDELSDHVCPTQMRIDNQLSDVSLESSEEK